jgi:hypothetical protein
VNVDHDMNNRVKVVMREVVRVRDREMKLRGKETHCRNSFLLCRDL